MDGVAIAVMVVAVSITVVSVVLSFFGLAAVAIIVAFVPSVVVPVVVMGGSIVTVLVPLPGVSGGNACQRQDRGHPCCGHQGVHTAYHRTIRPFGYYLVSGVRSGRLSHLLYSIALDASHTILCS